MESFSTGKEFRDQREEDYFDNLARVTGLFTGDIELLFRILERAATAKYREDFIAQTKNTNHLRNWLREAQRKSRDFESQLKKKEVELKAKKQIILQKNEKIEKLLKEGGQTRNLLNLEKMKNQKIKSLVEDDKIDEDLVKRRRINKGKAKINEITTVPVDPSLGQDEDNYTKESRNYTIYNIPWNLSDEEIYRLLTLEASKKMWLLSRMSIKRQKKYKTVKVTIKWVHSMDEAGKKTHIILNLRHKDRLIHICWYEGNLKLKDIKEYMKYKLYKNVEEEIKDKDQLELCRLYQEKYGLYYAQIIEVGGKPYLEATFPSKEQQKDSKETDRNLVLEMPVDLVTQQTSDPIETHKILDEREEIKIKAESKEIFDKNKGEKQKEKIKEENQEEVIDDVSRRWKILKTLGPQPSELLKTFEAELIKDICQLFQQSPIGLPDKKDRQYKTLAYLVGKQNLFKREDCQLKGAQHDLFPNGPVIAASLGKKHLRLTLDRLYIRVKDMLQPPSQGNNFEDLEPQQSWAQPEQSAPIISTESQAMIIDSKLSADATSFTPKLADDLVITWDVSVITPPIVTLPAAKSKKGREKQRSIQKVTCDNNIVHESQNRQCRTIMVYDVPTKWSPDKIRSTFSDWSRVLNIFLKTQHKYYMIRVDIVLTPTKDTEFILMPWCTQLRASFRFPADTTEDAIYSKFTPDGESLLQYTRAAAWKVIKDKQGLNRILYFEMHERLMRALTLQMDKIKLTNFRMPLPIKSKKTKDKKSASTQKP
ncbi:hypothetical protein RclHR1_17050004 [Rhizophagus clarus]|uniref:Uncharacterized protein n=1 Tax=Rhizophagus clarus TaxID=94130 RepID=A0A2Z6RBU4_9GLOM|nr:hypothetical protein RclHR1_17050004 [Rhizophagus clarus]